MEYFRTEDGQIQADLARRLGTVLKQYHSQIISIEKYEVSLSLSILQTLLTNCVELLDNMRTLIPWSVELPCPVARCPHLTTCESNSLNYFYLQLSNNQVFALLSQDVR